MRLNYINTAAVCVWILAMCATGLALGATSLVGWVVVAGFALLPPLILARWLKDDPNLSESIHDALR